jgi:hypothetical protein
MVSNPLFLGYHILPQIGPLTTLQSFFILVSALALVMGKHGGEPMDLRFFLMSEMVVVLYHFDFHHTQLVFQKV